MELKWLAGRGVQRWSTCTRFSIAVLLAIALTQSPAEEDSVAGEFYGSLIVELGGGGVVGDVIFGDPKNHRFAAALPLQTVPVRKAAFSHLANSPGFFTGLALFNPGEKASSVSIEILNPDGRLTGKQSVLLQGRTRISKLLTQLIPESGGQSGGQVVLTSTEPVVAQQLFGDSQLNLMAAVPPQVVDPQVCHVKDPFAAEMIRRFEGSYDCPLIRLELP